MFIPIRKLKKKHGYHGRLFTNTEEAEKWIERMRLKMGSDYEFGTQPYKMDDDLGYLTLGYLHRKET